MRLSTTMSNGVVVVPHLGLDALRYVPALLQQAPSLASYCNELLIKHGRYSREAFDDLPEIRDWMWTN